MNSDLTSFYNLTTFGKDIDILGIYTLFYYERTKDFHFAGERHNFWEMVYVDSGEILVTADNKEHMVRQGEIIFHKPMELHTISSNKKDPNSVVIMSFSTQGKGMSYYENRIFTMDHKQKKIMSLILQEAQHIFIDVTNNIPGFNENPCFGAGQLLTGYIEELLITLMRSNKAGATRCQMNQYTIKNAENAFVEAIMNYLTDNIYSRITLQDVCDKFNMSKSYMCQLFKDTTGNSIVDQYIILKITEAKKLIRMKEYNITQISDKLHYTSIHHFTRSFKNVTGISPSNYAKSVR